MITIPKPNVNNLRGALPTVEQSRDEYIGSVYGAAALGYVTVIHTLEALDALQEKHADLIRHGVKRSYNAIMGTSTQRGELEKLRMNISSHLVNAEDAAWMQDFGNAAYECTLSVVERLRCAVANALGRYRGVPDINTFAAVVVAQSIASEAADYVERRARNFGAYTIVTQGNEKLSVAFLLNQMSCRAIDRHLTIIASRLIGPCLPRTVDLLEDHAILTGCKAVLNVMADVNTWIYAREKANELNNKKDDE